MVRILSAYVQLLQLLSAGRRNILRQASQPALNSYRNVLVLWNIAVSL